MDKELDWEAAWAYLQQVIQGYREAPMGTGIFGLTLVLYPLAERYQNGERTQELYDEIMEVE